MPSLRSSPGRFAATVFLAAISAPVAALAQAADLQAKPGQFVVKLSGFENLDVADATGHGAGGNSESEVEISPQYKTLSGVTFAGRAVFNLQAQTALGGSTSAWALTEPELSVFAIGSFGRLEIGERAGFPQSLIGFTPSEIAFTAAEFGPDSGLRLDPNGGLPPSFLPPALGRRIDGLTYLGYAARFYDDRSPKLIYVSPRSKGGFYGAFSYTPRTETDGGGFALADGAHTPPPPLDASVRPGPFRNVVQAALVWNHRTEKLDLSTGVTVSDAQAVSAPPASAQAVALLRSDSISPGVTATLFDTWTLGVSATYDGFSRYRRAPGARAIKPYGAVASVNHVSGPWVVGGYYQHAVGDTAGAGALPDLPTAAVTGPTLHEDIVDVGEVGASYLLDKNHDLLGSGHYTDLKLYASLYLYRLRGAGGADPDPRQSGAVFLTGVRFSFF
jgi:hypothetical protein